jgi:general secretion pathway protein I
MRSSRRSGFTLLEVMMAVAIMAIALGSLFSAQAGSVKMAQRARKLGFATLLARCKMGEIEEDIFKKGLPASLFTDSDNCCKDAPVDGFKCKWEIVPVVLPDTMFGKDDDKDGKSGSGAAPGGAKPSGASPSGDGKSGGLTGLLGAAAGLLGGKKGGGEDSPDSKALPKDAKELSKDGKALTKDGKQDPAEMLSGDPSRFLAGGGGGEVDAISSMAMQFVYPVLKPAFESQLRRASVKVTWTEGSAEKNFELTQYVVAEQPVPLATDPNDPNALLNSGSQGSTGLGTGTSTGASSTSATSWGGN